MKMWTLGIFCCCLIKFVECRDFRTTEASLKKYSKLGDPVKLIVRLISPNISTVVNLMTTEDENAEIKDFRDQLLTKILSTDLIMFRQDTTKKIGSTNGRRRLCTVFIIQSFNDFKQVLKLLTPEHYNFSGFYIVVLIDGKIAEIEEIFELFWKLQIFNVLVLFESLNGTVQVRTFFPFSSRNCYDTTPVLINEFSDGKFTKSPRELLKNKMKNLHGCTIRLATSHSAQPYVFADLQKNGSYHLSGREIRFTNALAESLNFKVNYTFIGTWGYLRENGTADGPFKALIEDIADLSIINFLLREYRLKFVGRTTSYLSEPLVFIVPPGRGLSAIETIYYPFALSVWLSVLSCFIIGILVILTTKKFPAKIQNFVFGSGTGNSFINLYAAFIGEAQPVAPKGNFARFLLMTFLLYSLVIRTAYQGSFFKLITSNKRHNEIQTIDEMIKNDFSFHVTSTLVDLVGNSTAIRSRLVMIPTEAEGEYFDKIGNDPNYNGAILQASSKAMYFSYQNYRKHGTYFALCREALMMNPIIIYTRRNFFLIDELDGKIELFKSAGLIDLWHRQNIEMKFHQIAASKAPKILNLQQLSGVFKIWFCGIVLAMISFVGEVLLSFIKSFRENPVRSDLMAQLSLALDIEVRRDVKPQNLRLPPTSPAHVPMQLKAMKISLSGKF